MNLVVGVGDRRIYVGLLLACVLGLGGVFLLRRAAGRVAEEGREPVSRSTWKWFAVSTIVAVGAAVGVGYVMGGWLIAVALSAATLLGTLAVAVAVARQSPEGTPGAQGG